MKNLEKQWFWLQYNTVNKRAVWIQEKYWYSAGWIKIQPQ